jgi:Copper type II ascorbate-dependent monooxygenase, C-terminal domain
MGDIRLLFRVVAATAALVLIASCSSRSSGTTATPGSTGTPSSTGAHASHGTFQPPPAAPLRAGERFINLAMPQPYTPAAPNGGTDEYRCFLVDPKLTSTAFLTGSQFLPQNSDIVHHAIFFRIDPDDVEAARRADESVPGPGWTCFGDAGIGRRAVWIAAWAPGANETLLDPGLGWAMPPGSQLVMQVHYNLLATGGKPGGADQSGIRLRLTDDAARMKPLRTALVAAPVELPCAPGESGQLCDRSAAIADVAHRFGADAGARVDQLNTFCNKGQPPVAGTTQHCDQKVPAPGTVYALAGHMHLLGRSIKVELNPGTPDARVLLDVPSYNFDDQSMRPLAKPVAVKAGDTLRVTCTHDATLRKRLPALQTLPAGYRAW